MRFQQSLRFGKAGESLIAQWLISKGYDILPVYEKIIDTGKGPQVFTLKGAYIAPDLLAFSKAKTLWIEAKHKTAFSWHRISQHWVTGIDLRHYKEYCIIEDRGPWPIMLLFLHEGGQAKDSPPNSPSGLFGNYLSYLRTHENHRHTNWGTSGMVYWGMADLKKLAEYTNGALTDSKLL